MPVKKRLAKARAHQITPRAVEAFVAGDEMGLHRALGLQPWEISPIEAIDEHPPTWATPASATFQYWPQARALRLALMRASRN